MIKFSSSVGRVGEQGERSPKPGKFAKDVEQPAPQPAVSPDSNGKFKFLLIVLKFY